MSRRELANAIRALSMDAVQKANSGHPGAPMGMADIAEVLWNDFLKHNPQNPDWVDRDRFILSNGHASMLLYSLLHLTGYDLPLSELKQFRQLHSKTPGHPGMAIPTGWKPPPARWAGGWRTPLGWPSPNGRWRRSLIVPAMRSLTITLVFMGDGCLMEGISMRPVRWPARSDWAS